MSHGSIIVLHAFFCCHCCAHLGWERSYLQRSVAALVTNVHDRSTSLAVVPQGLGQGGERAFFQVYVQLGLLGLSRCCLDTRETSTCCHFLIFVVSPASVLER